MPLTPDAVQRGPWRALVVLLLPECLDAVVDVLVLLADEDAGVCLLKGCGALVDTRSTRSTVWSMWHGLATSASMGGVTTIRVVPHLVA